MVSDGIPYSPVQASLKSFERDTSRLSRTERLDRTAINSTNPFLQYDNGQTLNHLFLRRKRSKSNSGTLTCRFVHVYSGPGGTQIPQLFLGSISRLQGLRF